MEGIGGEISQKIRSAIKAKLMEIGVYVDEELPDYVMVMVANKRSKDQMDDDLQLFLGKHTSLFTTWLHQVLQKLQEVTVANLGGTKRKLSEDSKKKKKSKQDLQKKEPKKKIKMEPDEKKEELAMSKEGDREKKGSIIEEDSLSSNKYEESVELKKKEKVDIRTVVEQQKETNSIIKTNMQLDELSSNNEDLQKTAEPHTGFRSKSRSMSSQPEDLDDDDCINIRTDGELLDTTEELNSEESSRKQREKEESASLKRSIKDSEKKRTTFQQSPIRKKNALQSVDNNSVDKLSQSETIKIQPSSHQSPPKITDKVVDARELLNRKKAAKQSENRTGRSRDRSMSPPRNKKDDVKETNSKIHRDERDARDKRALWENERESSSRKLSRDDERDRKVTRDRDSHSYKRDRLSRRTDSERNELRESKRRDSSNEPVSKRLILDRTSRNKKSDWDVSRSSKGDMESSGRRRESEGPRKRTGLVSRVVPCPQEPEDDVETPVSSVVKITPRPRRPPSQQPSSNLIMKAISEANKSLASMPQRPDSTQRARKAPIFNRTLRQLKRIAPEKIAVSITNPMALQNETSEVKDETNECLSSKYTTETATYKSSSNIIEITSRQESSANNEINSNEEWDTEEKVKEKSQPEDQECELELEPTPELQTCEELTEELDPQFVVTLSGYDPDGLFSQSELDLGDDGECDDWLKENVEKPLLTSTPDEVPSPQPKRERHTSPIIIMNPSAVNHSNLIEVELVKTKNAERCKYWPACRLADKCIYYHPTKPCKIFPNCKFGDACMYIHPQCKFNSLCTRKDCVFAHTPAHTPQQPTALPNVKKVLYAANALLPCKFYPNCTNINCQFAHPSRACRFGLYCTKKDCSFDHGQVAPVDKLKWTRVTTT